MKISDEPWPSSNKISHNDNYYHYEGFKYALREWKKWTRDIIYVDMDSDDADDQDYQSYTRAEYTCGLMHDLLTIITTKGYKCLYSYQVLARKYMHYWLALSNSRTAYMLLPEPHHYGNQDDFEEWENTFPYNVWDEILESYYIFNDNTEISYRMRQDLPYFLWLYIDIDNSEIIQKRKAEEAVIQIEMNKFYDDHEGYKRLDTVTPFKKTESTFDSDKERS
jgi:hypothetical protein